MPCLEFHLCASMQALYDTLEGNKGFPDGSDMLVHWDAWDALEDSSTVQNPNSPKEASMQRWAWSMRSRTPFVTETLVTIIAFI